MQKCICSCSGGVGARTKHEETHSIEEENRRGPGSKLWRQTCLERVTIHRGKEGGVERRKQRWDWELRRCHRRRERGMKGMSGRELEGQSW